jgi:hypothetical protein
MALRIGGRRERIARRRGERHREAVRHNGIGRRPAGRRSPTLLLVERADAVRERVRHRAAGAIDRGAGERRGEEHALERLAVLASALDGTQPVLAHNFERRQTADVGVRRRALCRGSHEVGGTIARAERPRRVRLDRVREHVEARRSDDGRRHCETHSGSMTARSGLMALLPTPVLAPIDVRS